MPWFQPKRSPPTASSYFGTGDNSLANNEEEEYEFGERPPRRSRVRQRQGQEQSSQTLAESLLQDPLARRMMSLMSPLISSPAGTGAGGTITGGGTRVGSGASSSAAASHQINGPLPFIINNSSAAFTNISPFPHPSFPHREYTAAQMDESAFSLPDVDASLGYTEHAYFFHPRGITADKPFEASHWQHDHDNGHNHGHGRHLHVGQGNQSRYNQGRDYQQNNDSQWNHWENGNGQGQQHHYDNQQHLTNNKNSHDYEYSQVNARDEPNASQHGHRFGYTYPDDNDPIQKNKRKKKQRRIVQNIANGALGTTANTQHEHEQGWGQVGQISSYHSSNNGTRHDPEGKSRPKKKKKKKKSKKRPMPDIRAIMDGNGNGSGANASTLTAQNEMGGVEEVDVGTCRDGSREQSSDGNKSGGHNGDDFQKKTLRSKRTKRSFPKDPSHKSMTTNENSPTNNASMLKPILIETMEIFAETYDVKNAGGSDEALRSFLQLIKEQKHISWTMIFHDAICSTPSLPTTKKYCTPKGPPCKMWNCTCDNQIRAIQAAAPLVGAMFVFPMDGGSENLDCFLLPLCPTEDPQDGPKDIDPGFERMARWSFLPISCDTTLQQRWETFRKILLDRSVVKVTFNAQMGLMPYHYHCAYDLVNNENSPNESSACGYLDLALPNIWDLRLASWMLSPHAKEETLEMEEKKRGFAHMYPKAKCPVPTNASEQLLGLIEAKENLEFLHTLYPVVDKLLERNGLKDAFTEIESPVQSVLSSMECFGVGFKAERLLAIQSSMESQIDSLTAEARSITMDNDFMLSSPQQVSQYIFEKMGLRPPTQSLLAQNSQSANQHMSTSEETLKAMRKELKAKNGDSPRIIELVLHFRALNKVLSTYIRPYPKLARDSTDLIRSRKVKRRSKKKSSNTKQIQKIHPMWMQTTVRTGRLSCRKPNLQQVPTGSVMGVCPRNAFTTSTKETCLFACDYSQNEVRILAHMSNDEDLIRLFTQKGTTDIYKQMSSVISGKPPADVTDEERAISKQVTLAIMYGMGINSVAKKLGIDKAAAQTFFQTFYGRFRGVKHWMDNTVSSARSNKFVSTITGRKRYLDNITSGDRALKSQAERQAINTVIQGSAADLMKLAMLKMASRITDWRKECGNGETGTPPRMLLQIHDELLFELPANQVDVDRLKKIVIRSCTEECAEELQLKVPLKLKCSVGTSWGNMKEI